ncbi:MAG: transglycosylase domain-containing protein, partial [Aeromonadaceae bacterium]
MDAVEQAKTEPTTSPRQEEATQQAQANQKPTEASGLPPTAPKRSVSGWIVRLLYLTGVTTITAGVVWEMQTSWLQAHLLSRYAPTLTWQVEPGPSDAILFPANGPVDKRQGYALLPQLSERLSSRGFGIEQQAHFSAPLLDYASRGLFIPYDEKSQSGITLLDCSGTPFYQSRYPHYQYPDFTAIPALVLQALLYIENRDLLSDDYPMTNPAIDWPRFANALASQLGKQVGIQDHGSGGSTLATQMEKFRHSPDGRTNSGKEKLRQMASASVRAYRHGPLTHQAREKLALDYLNSVPLAAAPGYGEVHGLGDGLHTWFAADVARSNSLLDQPISQEGPLAEQGLALRQVVALLIAHRRPSF